MKKLKNYYYIWERSVVVTSLYCLLFSSSKMKGLKRISKSATNVVLALKFLWTSKFVFALESEKLTIKLHSRRPIRSLILLHCDNYLINALFKHLYSLICDNGPF